MGESTIPLNPGSGGRNLRTRQRVIGANTVEEQYYIPTTEEVVTYDGRFSTFRIPGRAGTTGQKLAALHNATGSAVLVKVHELYVDMYDTAAKVVAPPVVRAWKFTALPTNGSSAPKQTVDSSQSSNASVTAWQDASADGTNSATALTATLPAGTFLASRPAPRALTLVGDQQVNRGVDLLEKVGPVTLRPLEGICVFLDYTAATSNPVTDMWLVDGAWREYTLP